MFDSEGRLTAPSIATLKAISAHLAGALWILNVSLDVVYTNPWFETWSRFTLSDLQSTPQGWRQFLHAEDIPRVIHRAQVDAAARTNSVINVRYCKKGDPTSGNNAGTWFASRGGPLFSEDGNLIGWAGFSFEIDSLGAIYRIVAHDTRNDIQHVLNYFEMERRLKQTEEEALESEAGDRSFQRIATAFKLIGDFAKASWAGLSTSTDLKSLLLAYQGLFRREGLTVQMPAWDTCDNDKVKADPSVFGAIVMNIISNAEKYGAKNVTILPKTAIEVEATSRTEAGFPNETLDVSHIGLAFVDDGRGMTARTLGGMFRGTRGENVEGTTGSGKGLTICYQLQRIHGGWIGATSAGQGRGSTFTVYFPLDKS